MKKKLSALAVAFAFAPAIALAQDVTIYGKMELLFENVEAEGTDAPAGDLPAATACLLPLPTLVLGN